MPLPFPSRALGVLLLAALFEAGAVAAPVPAIPDAPNVDARNYVLIDPASGQVLAARAADQKAPPASLTKLMTTYLTFQAAARGSLKLDQTIPVSVAAWKAGGSTMFLQPDLPATVEQMIQGMVVVSGNDAAVALAEAIAGNTDSFVQMMNATARQLGMANTHFDNVDGLPTPTHRVSAHDIGILTEAIMRQYPQYLHYFGEKTFTYNHVTQNNWNPLVFSDATVTGMKTGHTDEAGYCLDATAVRKGRPLIAVVLGSTTRKGSAHAAEALLDYGYHFFETRRAYRAGQIISTVRNNQANPAQVPIGTASDVWVSLPIGRYALLKPGVSLAAQMSLPLKRGQQVGTLILSEGSREVARVPLVALKSVEKAGWLGHWWNVIRAKL
ncbi:peptidase [Sulfuriferula plumbiphila]|uniref:serine-type D-Ala-D-Ala carboxypeptidase n=1 Tax=Sulfuriferula plumbiphila TaxID=171865 RepID=A0A512LC42_9PROT|nr:D-alanyl-D-alanine carboxypeptidase family protein [Sulfuriferula plumbiphila]BBP04113.1 peptidase [Sulfuriferula plumbiphila]GEP31972.1 peptidase [Sulfuriferula plumbiphila]